MTGPLWKREWNGATRPVIRRPWAVPIVIGAWAALCRLTGLEFPPGGVPAGVGYWPPSAILAIWGPQLALALAAVGIVAWTVVRDRTDPGLALSLIPRREIALAKTFAPTALTLLVIASLAMVEAFDAVRLGDRIILWRLGLYYWNEAPTLNPQLYPSAGTQWLLAMLLPLRTLLLGGTVVTLTSWLGARSRSAWRVMIQAILVLCLLTVTAMGTEELVRKTLIPLERLAFVDERGQPIHVFPTDSETLWPLVLWETALVSLTRVLLPLCWLIWWWRWTARGFAERYLRDM